MTNASSRQELVEGLCAAQAEVAPKYLYDDLGCCLFELITRLPEYYPTCTELTLMTNNADDIMATVGTGATLIDLGAGNCRKARLLFPKLLPRQYVAIDISTDFVRQALCAMQAEFPDIDMFAVGADLSQRIDLPAAVNGARRTFFYPGSSIGNFDPDAALALLARIREHCRQRGGLLVGIDLVKDAQTLHAAYNDALGLTAAFNRNVLNHVNALIGSDFRLCEWRHRAFYDPRRGRVEMHLEAAADITVSWPGGRRRFAAGDSIHTENSYKYRLDDFKALLAQAGFGDVRAWTDERQWFAVCYAGV
ncbi:MAG: L-histidine N(alpha)-methyltransferase [Rhodocyclaceae bacterium]|nr:L-histidine N(alpha)-methyltransferase [Rhodocyclaceae bacterium]